MSTASVPLPDPRRAQVFRFVRCRLEGDVAQLVYAFDDGPELVECIRFPAAPPLPAARRGALQAALRLLHLIAGVSYYKAGVPPEIRVEDVAPDADTAALLEELYAHGLAEFAWRNKLELAGRIRFPRAQATSVPAAALGLGSQVLVPIGGGKDSLVAIEALKAVAAPAALAWVGHSPLIAACAERTGLPALNVRRELSPTLFAYNRMGAWNGHIPVTAVNSAILVVLALRHGFGAISFANERSASAATLEYAGGEVNHQWSKGFAFEQRLHAWVHRHVAADLEYFSLLRPFSELAVTRAFARLGGVYFDAFSSCNRNFRLLGPRPADRWCSQCPKCHFVFLALAPFLPKPRLVGIFGRNLLDDPEQAAGFDALMEYRDHKPFECVGEAREARAAMHALSQRAEWAEDALVRRFRREILPHLAAADLALAPWLEPAGEHCIPPRLAGAIDVIRGA